VPITLQGTVGGFSAEFVRKLPEVERAMIAHGLEPTDFIISKNNSASSNVGLDNIFRIARSLGENPAALFGSAPK
jgi:hypothetical protein